MGGQEQYEDLLDQMWNDVIHTRKYERLHLALTTWLEATDRLDRYMILRAMTLAWLDE